MPITKHGHARRGRKTKEFLIWQQMIARCLNPSNNGFKNYGGRGILVCEEWRKFANFFADMGQKPDGKSLDRINNDGNYEPSNCRWATRHEQNRNRRNIRLISFANRAQSLREWEVELGWSKGTLWRRIDRGLSIEDALFGPRRNSR